MTQTSHPAHNGPYTELTADAARDLRRPIAPAEVRFKVQAVRWTKRDGSDKVATAAQVVAYIDARTVIARLNLLFPGALARPHRRAAARDAPHPPQRRRHADADPPRRPGRGQGRRHPLLPLPPGRSATRRSRTSAPARTPRPPTPTRSSAPPCAPASASPCTPWTRPGCASATPTTSCASAAPASPTSTSAPPAGCAACTRRGSTRAGSDLRRAAPARARARPCPAPPRRPPTTRTRATRRRTPTARAGNLTASRAARDPPDIPDAAGRRGDPAARTDRPARTAPPPTPQPATPCAQTSPRPTRPA